MKILEALDQGADPHVATFSMMSGVPVNEVTLDQRATGKVLNYAALFGSTGYSLARSLKCPESEANEQSKKFWETYPKMREWRDIRYDYANKHARTYTVLGRVRKLPEMFTSSTGAKNMARRRSVNTATQGSCGDCLKLAIRDFYKHTEDPNSFLAHHNARIPCPVYDAVLVEMDLPQPSSNMAEWLSSAERTLRQVLEVKLEYKGLQTKMRVKVGHSVNNWLEAMGK
jgi:DNA polymerase-1